MSEPKPWIEEGAPPTVAQLLDAARLEQPSEASLARTLFAVGAVGGGVSATAAAAIAKASASSAAGTKLTLFAASLNALKWLLLGAALGGVVVASVTAESSRFAPATARAPASQRTPNRLNAQAAEPARALEVRRVGSPQPAQSVTPPSNEIAVPASVARAKPAPSLPVPPDAERLAEEVRAIDRATAALASGRAARALAALDDYERQYPEHRFAPEALYLRLEALRKSGQMAAARAVAERLVQSYPMSPQSVSARSFLGQTIP